MTRNNVPRHNDMPFGPKWTAGISGHYSEAWAITPRHGLLLRGMGYCSAARSGSVREPVEASGTSGSCPEAGGRQWKLVEDKEGVGRGLGGSGEVWEVRRRSGKPWESAEEAGKAWEVTVRYKDE